jgi:hypothetical protein
VRNIEREEESEKRHRKIRRVKREGESENRNIEREGE